MRLKKFRSDVKAFIQFVPDENPYEEGHTRPSPPYELSLLWQCEKYQTLPYPGSLLEQPHILMMLFNIIHEERAEWNRIQEINRKLQTEFIAQGSNNARKSKKPT